VLPPLKTRPGRMMTERRMGSGDSARIVGVMRVMGLLSTTSVAGSMAAIFASMRIIVEL
jgi:hypothetical protein